MSMTKMPKIETLRKYYPESINKFSDTRLLEITEWVRNILEKVISAPIIKILAAIIAYEEQK